MNILVLDEKEVFDKVIDSSPLPQTHSVQYSGKFHFNQSTTFFRRFDYVFYRIYYDELNQMAAWKAWQAGVRIVHFSDGIFEWANSHREPRGYLWSPLIATDVFVISDFDIAFLESRNLHITPYKYIPMSAQLMNPRKTTPSKNFLISTANTPYFNEAEFENLTRMLDKITIQLKIQGYTFAFRIFDERIKDHLRISNEDNFITDEFEAVMSEFSALITTPSTIAITAMHMGKPVCQLRYRDDPITFSTGWNMFSEVSIAPTLDSMAQMDTLRMDFQRTQGTLLNQTNHSFDSLVKTLESNIPNLNAEKFPFDQYMAARYFSFRYLIFQMIKQRVLQFFRKYQTNTASQE